MSSLEIMWYMEKVQEANVNKILNIEKKRRLKAEIFRMSLDRCMKRL